jgi:uncharacterized RDD family membrane protein YckC
VAAPAAPDDDVSATERPYAGIVSRTVALAIDAGTLTIGFAIVSGVLGLILSLFTAVEVSSPGAVLGAAAMWSLVVSTYFVLFWTLAGETPGMRLMALRVRNAAGDPPSFGKALVRFAGLVLAAIPFCAGFLPILFDERRRGLQDMLAGTVVVYAPRSRVRTSPPAAAITSSP